MGVVVIGDAAARHIYMLRNPDAADSTGFFASHGISDNRYVAHNPFGYRARLRQIL